MIFSAGRVSTLPNGDLLLQSAPERYIVWLAVFALVMPVSLFLWRRGIGGRVPPGAFVVSWFIPLIIAPGIAMESVRVTRDALVLKTGYWFAPNVMQYRLPERIREGRNLRGDLTWTFHYPSGTRSLNLPDLLEGNRARVAAALSDRGVVVVNSNKQE